MNSTIPAYPEGHELLAGKTVLVTAAAGSGIGFATAKRCIEEGARVMISDIHERRLREAGEKLSELAGSPVSMASDALEISSRRKISLLL